MRRFVMAALGSVAVAALTAGAGQQAVDPSTLGPQVGQRAVSFQLPDQHGKIQSLATTAGPKGTMLVFFRSADW